MKREFDGKVAMVTAAGAGIGAATARAFAARGAKVMLADICEESGLALAKELCKEGAKAEFVRCDAMQEGDIAAAVEQTVTRLGGLDLAANIVGDSIGDANGPDMHLKSVEGW